MDTSTFSTFNVGELTPVDGIQGLRLSRYPSRMESEFLTPGGKVNCRKAVGCEVRLIPATDRVVFRISSPEQVTVQFHQGDFWIQAAHLTPGQVKEVEVLLRPELIDLPDEAQRDLLFSPRMIRMRVQSAGVVYLHSIDTYGAGSRPPTSEELPSTRWLAWGSSITQCDTYGYVHQAAHRLRVDILNKGMSGSCGVEPAVAQYHCECEDWDFATLEWGVNIRGSVEPDEFKRRIDGCLSHFIATGKPVFLITPFPNDAHLKLGDPDTVRRQHAFGDLLRSAAEQAPEQVKLIEGADVLKKWNWLAGDLVHPTHEGQNMMGEQLANLLRPYLRDLPAES